VTCSFFVMAPNIAQAEIVRHDKYNVGAIDCSKKSREK